MMVALVLSLIVLITGLILAAFFFSSALGYTLVAIVLFPIWGPIYLICWLRGIGNPLTRGAPVRFREDYGRLPGQQTWAMTYRHWLRERQSYLTCQPDYVAEQDAFFKNFMIDPSSPEYTAVRKSESEAFKKILFFVFYFILIDFGILLLIALFSPR